MRIATLLAAVLATSFFVSDAWAQGAVLQTGNAVTQRHAAMFWQNGVIGDAGPAAGGPAGSGLSELGITNNTNCALGINSGPNTGAHYQLCLGTPSGGGLLTYQAMNGATPQALMLNVNGQQFTLPGSSSCLGCGSMAGQNSTGINVTGGTLSGVTLSAIAPANIIGNATLGQTVDSATETVQNATDTAFSIYHPTGAGPYADAVRGVLTNTPNSTTQNANAVGAYILNKGAGNLPNGNAVGLFSFGVGAVNNAQTWGGNTLCVTNLGITGAACYGWEVDFTTANAGDIVLGYIVAGSVTVQPAIAVAFQVNPLSVQSPGLALWSYGFACIDGVIGGICNYTGATQTSGVNIPSQVNQYGYRNGSGAYHFYAMNVDTLGGFHITDNDVAGAHSVYFDSLLNLKNIGTLQVGGFNAAVNPGEFAIAKVSASGVAPGAFWGKLSFTAGTSVGTCKLIAYAGTSTVPTTIVDNIGGGC